MSFCFFFVIFIVHSKAGVINCPGSCGPCSGLSGNDSCELECDITDDCAGDTLTCSDAFPCIITCSAYDACYGAVFNGEQATSLTVNCMGVLNNDGDCYEAVVNAKQVTHVTVNCNGDIGYSCSKMKLYCGTGVCTIHCDGNSCFGVTVDATLSSQYICTGTGCSSVSVTTADPTTAVPTTSPTTATPTTTIPTTAVPTTATPTTATPTTSVPTTSIPTTTTPTTSIPTTATPTTSRPTTYPTTAAPTTSTPTILSPTTSVPSLQPTATPINAGQVDTDNTYVSTTLTDPPEDKYDGVQIQSGEFEFSTWMLVSFCLFIVIICMILIGSIIIIKKCKNKKNSNDRYDGQQQIYDKNKIETNIQLGTMAMQNLNGGIINHDKCNFERIKSLSEEGDVNSGNMNDTNDELIDEINSEIILTPQYAENDEFEVVEDEKMVQTPQYASNFNQNNDEFIVNEHEAATLGENNILNEEQDTDEGSVDDDDDDDDDDDILMDDVDTIN